MKNKRLLKSKSVLIGGTIIILFLLSAIFAPYITPYNPYEMDVANKLLPPSSEHLFGTDEHGRDLFTRILYGSRISLFIGLVSVGIASFVGVSLGLLSAYFGGWIEIIIMRLVDTFLSFPVILLSIGIIAALGPSKYNVMIALGVVYWTSYARVVRSSVLEVKEEEFIHVERTLGASNFRIIVKHILPNVLSPIIVLLTLGLGMAIVAESSLSFLGLGVQPPEPSWGWTLSFGIQFLHNAPHLSIFPGLSIMLVVLGFNLLGDGIRDLTDPKFKN